MTSEFDVIPESQEQEKAVLEPHNFRIQDNDLGAGGPKAKYKQKVLLILSATILVWILQNIRLPISPAGARAGI